MPDIFEIAGVQMRIVLEIAVRDTPKRVLCCSFICFTLGLYADFRTATILALWILIFEAVNHIFFRTLPPNDRIISRSRSRAVIMVYTVSTVAYGMPGILLMQQPSQAAQIMGLLWITGIVVHQIATHINIVFLGWGTILSTCAIFLYGIATLHPLPIAPFKTLDGVLLALSCLMWVGNTIEVTLAQATSRKAFGEVRFEAEKRLEQLDHLASHDALTGLLNRRAFDEALSDALLMAPADALPTVMLFDLDRFKPVNDKYGHAAGDAVLVAVAQRLTKALSQGTIARLGGDEFVAILPESSPIKLSAIATTVETAIAAPIEFDGAFLEIGISSGFATAQPNDTISTILARADAQMYRAKSALHRRISDQTPRPSRPRA